MAVKELAARLYDAEMVNLVEYVFAYASIAENRYKLLHCIPSYWGDLGKRLADEFEMTEMFYSLVVNSPHALGALVVDIAHHGYLRESDRMKVDEDARDLATTMVVNDAYPVYQMVRRAAAFIQPLTADRGKYFDGKKWRPVEQWTRVVLRNLLKAVVWEDGEPELTVDLLMQDSATYWSSMKMSDLPRSLFAFANGEARDCKCRVTVTRPLLFWDMGRCSKLPSYPTQNKPYTKLSSYLNDIFNDEADLVSFFVDVVSAAIAGIHRKTIYFLFGPPHSGKTTLMRIFDVLFGGMSVTLPNCMLAKSAGCWNRVISAAANRRLLCVDDVVKDVPLDWALLRTVTGGGVTAVSGETVKHETDVILAGSEVPVLCPDILHRFVPIPLKTRRKRRPFSDGEITRLAEDLFCLCDVRIATDAVRSVHPMVVNSMKRRIASTYEPLRVRTLKRARYSPVTFSLDGTGVVDDKWLTP